jgi:hypothetical protein
MEDRENREEKNKNKNNKSNNWKERRGEESGKMNHVEKGRKEG